MTHDNRIHIPSSQGGLIRYFDEVKSKFEIKPGFVIILIILVIAIVLLLHALGKRFFGLV